MNRRVVFTDFDGVINTIADWNKLHVYRIDKVCLLARFALENDADLVIQDSATVREEIRNNRRIRLQK